MSRTKERLKKLEEFKGGAASLPHCIVWPVDQEEQEKMRADVIRRHARGERLFSFEELPEDIAPLVSGLDFFV